MIPFLIFSLTMAVYLSTIAPTLSFFDSGEMISGAYTLGVSHPPGYPVYVTLGKMFTLLPLGNVAFRMNLMSSFFAAMTSVLIYYITRAALTSEDEQPIFPGLAAIRLTPADVAGIFSALAFGFSYNLWAWAVVSKFYTLNAFVVACILMLLIRWRRARREEGDTGGGHSLAYLYTISFVCGIAGVVHISQFILIPVYLLYILIVDGSAFLGVDGVMEVWRDAKRYWYVHAVILLAVAAVAIFNLAPVSPRLLVVCCAVAVLPYLFIRGALKVKVIIIMIFFFMLGHSIYLHMPLRASQEPLINWGMAADWKQFKWVYNREGYPVVGGERTLSLFFKQLSSFDLVREFTWAGLPLIFFGFWAHYKKDWRHCLILAFGSVILVSAIVIGGNPVEENIFLLEQFYIPVYIFLTVVMGGAVYTAIRRAPEGAWAIGLTVPFIILGNIPLKYVFNFTGNVPASRAPLLPIYYPLNWYLPVLAVVCGLVTVTVVISLRRNSVRPLAYSAFLILLLVLYPMLQVRMNYWKNDRSKNFVAFDMGTAELQFTPQFATLFTWGDSGAFPMWYLQDVEKKRPDVLLIHTPHLPLQWFLDSIRRDAEALGDPEQLKRGYKYLRNYNGAKGIGEIESVEEDFRDPTSLIREIIRLNPGREFAFDYSSRYSVDMPYNVYPYGITYRSISDTYMEENDRTWRFLVTRNLPNPPHSLDLDETKAASIYGYVHADLGKKYLELGRKPLALAEFETAVRYAPELSDSLAVYFQ